MFNPEKFINNNKYEIKKACKDTGQFKEICNKLSEIKVTLESSYAVAADKLLKENNIILEKYIVNYDPNINESNIALYDEWLHRS